MQYIIGIDIGTTNTKAVAFTDSGEVLGSAGTSYPVFSDGSGRHELDPEAIWKAFVSVLGQIRMGAPGGVKGIAFSCAMHSLIAVDEQGIPLTRAMTWADLRPSACMKAVAGGETIHGIYRQTGTPIHPMSPLFKLLWLRTEEPELFGRAARFISIKEYIWWRLFGKYQVDHSIVSATGLFDIHARRWHPASLSLAGIRADQLSEPVPCVHQESVLIPGCRELFDLPAGLPFIIGGSDGCLANLGSNAVHPGETALTIGTSGAVRMTSPRPAFDPKERLFNYILTDQLYVCGGATNNGGSAVQWYIGQLLGKKADDHLVTDELVAGADAVAPGCEGLIFLPYLQGERAPIWNASARGVFFGIRSVHGQHHFMRSVLEGISYSLYQIGLSLEETIGPIQCIYASGGFTRSGSWLQLIADVFGKKVYVTGVADASAIGAAIIGMYSLGIIKDLASVSGMIQIQATYEPDMERQAVYQKNYRVFAGLYERLKDLMGSDGR